MKKLKITFLLLLITILTFAQNAERGPGSGVKGVKVALGKNPSGKIIMTTVTDEKGESEITIPEKGSYTITLNMPNDGQAKSQGGPVKGVKVALGCNPPGCPPKNKISNSKGEVVFENLESGNYRIIAGADIAAKCPWCSSTIDHLEMAAHQKTCPSKPTKPIGFIREEDTTLIPINPKPLKPKPRLDLIIGAGTFNPNSELKEMAYLQNMTSATLGLRLSVLQKGWWDLGIKLKGTYLTGNKDQVNPIPPPFNIDAQTSTSVAYTSKDSPRQTGMLVEVGPEININIIGGLVLSAGVDLGYAKIKNSEFSVIQTLDYNATVTKYPLLGQKETEISGLSVTPNLNLKYRLGRVSIYTAFNYVVLPKVNTVGSTFVPNGNPSAQNLYSNGQMQDGVIQPWQKNLSGGAINLSAGININISKKSDYVGHVTLLR